MVALLLVSAIAVNAQTVVVQGRVSDENGPVPNATVLEKGTRNSVTAEANGTFTIRVKQGAKLIITAVGFETTEVDASSTYMNISVKIKADELQEVLVTSAFGVKKSQRTTAFSSQVINAEQLTVIRQPNLNNALAGKVAGIQVRSQSQAALGRDAVIRLRGEGGIGRIGFAAHEHKRGAVPTEGAEAIQLTIGVQEFEDAHGSPQACDALVLGEG